MANQSFIEKSIFGILGLEHLPLTDRVLITNELVQLIQRRMMVRVVDELNDDALKTFTELVEAGQEHKFNEFIEEYIPNYYDILTEETLKVKEEMGDIIAELDGGSSQ